MKRFLLFSLVLTSMITLRAQSVDVTKVMADTKTYLFNDGKNTVKNYIYERLQSQTSCCGSDRIYLEVKVDPTGCVLSAKALTGKSDCFKESVISIVKSIKWDATGFQGPKSIYFEVKPEVPCEGRKNEFAAIPVFNNACLDANGAAVPMITTSPAIQPPAIPLPQPTSTVVTPPVTAAVTPPPAAVSPAQQTPAVNMTATPTTTYPSGAPMANGAVGTVTTQPAVTTPSSNTTTMAVPVPRPALIAQAGPSPAELRETAEEVTLLRAEMDKRMKEEESKVIELPAVDKKGDKKEGEKAGADWGVAEDKECKPVIDPKSGKPLVDKTGKPVMDCKPKLGGKDKEDKVAPPKPLTPEEIAAKAKEEAEAAERARLDKMSPAERERALVEKKRKDEEERIRMEERKAADRIAEAEKKIRDAENAQRKSLEEAKRQELDVARAKEDLERAKTEAQRQKDDAEIARIDAEKRELETKKKEQERLLQARMAEIQKMQQEMDRMTTDLSKQQEDLLKVEEKQRKVKEEIAARKGGVVIESPSPMALPTSPMNDNRNTPPAPKKDTAPSDTSAINKLMQHIDILRQQIYRMQQELDATRANGMIARPMGSATTSVVSTQGTSASVNTDWNNINYQAPVGQPTMSGTAPRLTENVARGAVDAQNAASNQSWKMIDYNNTESLAKTPQGQEILVSEAKAGKPVDSKATRPRTVDVKISKENPDKVISVTTTPAPVVMPVPTPPAPITNPSLVPATAQAPVNYVSTGDKNPDASHLGTFANMPVPLASAPEYVDGEKGMKDYLRDNLKAQGVCGLAHLFAELNIDRNGNVATYKLIKAVPEEISEKLPSILLGMKFKTNPQTAPYTQSVYVEFKGDIRCDGKPSGKVSAEEDFLKVKK